MFHRRRKFFVFPTPPKSVLDYLNFDQLQPIFRTNCSNFLEMDKLIKVEARKQFSNGKYVLRERCDLQFAGESRAKYVSESAVSVAGRRRRRREENSSHMTPTYTPILDTPILSAEHIITHTLIGADSRLLPILSGTNCIFFEKKLFLY